MTYISPGRALGVLIGVAVLVAAMWSLSMFGAHGVDVMLPCRANFEYHNGHLVRPACSNLQLLGKFELLFFAYSVPLPADALIIWLARRPLAAFLQLSAGQRTTIADLWPSFPRVTLNMLGLLVIFGLLTGGIMVCAQTLIAPFIPVT